MDLLHHYESSSSSEDEEKPKKREEQNNDETKSSSSLGAPSSKDAKRGGGVTIVSEAKQDAFRRTVPHISGNWAGHVVFNITNHASSSWPIQEAIERFAESLQAVAGSSGPMIVRHSDLHISLSRPFYLQYQFIDSFVQALHDQLRYQSAVNVRVVADNRILVNDEQTRSFLVWSVQPTTSLLPLVKCIDTVLQQYQQPIYYQPPHFHVSLASFAANVVPVLNMEASNESFVLHLDEIQCTFGTTKSYTIQLASS